MSEQARDFNAKQRDKMAKFGQRDARWQLPDQYAGGPGQRLGPAWSQQALPRTPRCSSTSTRWRLVMG